MIAVATAGGHVIFYNLVVLTEVGGPLVMVRTNTRAGEDAV